ncbi:DUF433 domain-containing protein [Nocardia cyriacigeorgica]|uniref:DUF433 domain-containing protein n=1 Tax=Nocardia cyriacigeorgica TaxID=135487 RepID=UPI0013D5BBE8|nr:DUF433 domain-containing protein [Nocardia cyriacigeorgica]MBF6438298.1 DUF433 domain-containing protein [Nocardia cyriacigeorgica]MBF6453833.1 DUF433 domain-containing protein [Nocardia cyriacigeorgica]MBF6480185.1 DUF433 domain-containing protein [Nocardia cyriacigeorgica]MBF6551001.1 DUF433 domain-containing protein [Nocardia cyriacigeorgica]NEW27960.1 DUF433 domain-containing protein [Nocardia cyriacigeorgica]
MSHLGRITSDPEICHGKPVVRGLRYPVEMLLGLLASGMGTEDILGDYPDLQPEDILAVLEYAAAVTAQQTTAIFDEGASEAARSKRVDALNELTEMAGRGDFEMLLDKDEYRR